MIHGTTASALVSLAVFHHQSIRRDLYDTIYLCIDRFSTLTVPTLLPAVEPGTVEMHGRFIQVP